MIVSKNIRDLINVDNWQKMQDSITDVTGAYIIVCDSKGKPVLTNSNPCGFCSAVMEFSVLNDMCFRCRALGGYEAFTREATYIYKCHMGLLNAAVPLFAGDNYLGFSVVCARCAEGDADFEKVEPIYPFSQGETRPRESKNLISKKHGMTPVSTEKFRKIVEMLENINRYAISESMKADAFKPESPESPKEHWPDEKTARQGTETARGSYGDVSLLFPAFDYIAVHFREKISIQYLADLCHISPSYFSRQFAKETRESLPHYILKLRISYAKQQLSTTDKSIAEIGFDAGFGDSSHFIKSFKKFENTTPLHYRQTVK